MSLSPTRSRLFVSAVLCATAYGQSPKVPPPLPPPVLFPAGTAKPAESPTAAEPAGKGATPGVPDRAVDAPRPGTPSQPEPAPAPWKPIFEGNTVTGLKGLQKPDFLKAGWKIRGGTLSLTKEIKESGRKTGGDLITSETYENFELRFEWKLDVSSRGGVMYLVRSNLGSAPVGHLFQLIDDVRHPDGLKGGPIKRTGALYGVLPPGENKRLNDVDWNQGRLLIQGNHVEHWINDEKVLSYDLGSAELKKAALASKEKLGLAFGTKFKSPIVLLDAGENVAFRNIKIRQLPSHPSIPH